MFYLLNRPGEYFFFSDRGQWYTYIADIVDIKLLKTKAKNDLKTGFQMFLSLTSKIKVSIKCM